MFQPWKSDNGAVLPWEYLAAEKATYQVGQLLALDASTGYLEPIAADLVTTPPYLCMADMTIATAGAPPPSRDPDQPGHHLRDDALCCRQRRSGGHEAAGCQRRSAGQQARQRKRNV